MDPDPYEEEIEDVVLDYERKRHWCMVLRTTMEGWIGNRTFYILISGMYTIHRGSHC